MAKKYEFDLSELSEADQKKIKDLYKKTAEEKKLRDQRKELQKYADKIFGEYCRKNAVSDGISFEEKKMMDFGSMAWKFLKEERGMQADNIDSAMNFLRAICN